MRRFTRDEFVAAARSIHGDKYDYSKVEYINSRTKVCIICPIHGEFWVRPDIHLMGCLCKKCQFEKQKKRIFGEGVNDLLLESHTQSYKIWKHILMRSCDKEFQSRHTSYKDCTICEEWKIFSNFKKWFNEHYVEGWEIDKDVLFKGNKEYAPSKCCFLPHIINGMLAKSDKKRGKYPIGVNKHGNGFRAKIVIHNNRYNIGTFETVIEAFNAYKKTKEDYIKELADKWKDKLEPHVYVALYNYKVEITD